MLALEILQKKYHGKKDEWKMIGKKAMKWVRATVTLLEGRDGSGFDANEIN